MLRPTNPTRRLRAEQLENRKLLAADIMCNHDMPSDVNGDAFVTPVDALTVIKALTSPEGEGAASPGFVDVNADGVVSPVDALTVINDINNGSGEASDTDDAEDLDDAEDMDDADDMDDAGGTTGALTADGESNGTRDQALLELADAPLAETLADEAEDGTQEPADAETDDSNEVDEADENETELVALMSGTSDEKVEVEFETESESGQTEMEFSVELRGFAANVNLDVTVGGVVVGQVTTDANGDAEMEFSNESEPDAVPFPSNFPQVAIGTEVQVGTLIGSLAIEIEDEDDDSDD